MNTVTKHGIGSAEIDGKTAQCACSGKKFKRRPFKISHTFTQDSAARRLFRGRRIYHISSRSLHLLLHSYPAQRTTLLYQPHPGSVMLDPELHLNRRWGLELCVLVSLCIRSLVIRCSIYSTTCMLAARRDLVFSVVVKSSMLVG